MLRKYYWYLRIFMGMCAMVDLKSRHSETALKKQTRVRDDFI